MHPQHLAELHLPAEREIVIGERLSGRIFKDTLKSGNHPFRDGEDVNTSPVRRITTVDETTYISTHSGTTYRIHRDAPTTGQKIRRAQIERIIRQLLAEPDSRD